MVSGRDTAHTIQDGKFGYEPDAVSNFESPDVDRDEKLTDEVAVRIGREIEAASTNWINSGRRNSWNNSLRAFQSLHPMGSKYTSGDYRFRSTLYRPKSRAMVRRSEMATAAAFFANEEVVSITADDDDDPQQQASAKILEALLQYRLTKTIPWFLTLVGARQDCEVMGITVGKVGWHYEERYWKSERRPKTGPDGSPMWNADKSEIETERVGLYRVVKDEPFADLLAPENFRFEPGCDWRNPVKSSPYLIELCPVYIDEALERMESRHGAPAEWRRVAESALRSSSDLQDDVTRRTRESGRVPGKDSDAFKARSFDIAWTRINTLRWRGQDWTYRTLASTGEILEKPRPLEEVHLHGERPYVVGCVIVETHKTYPSGKIELTTDLQRAANQDWNSRFDAMTLNLQPRQFVKAGAAQDINDLQRFSPGRVVTVNAAKGESMESVISWDRPPPVDAASFQEQDRINLDWDDLTGAFTNSSVRSSEVSEQSATGMHLMSGEASSLTEYELRVFAETFAEPMIRLLIKLEQAYESDAVILANAGRKAQLFQKFNVSEITDELLNQEVTTKVNVGIGATNPGLKLKNFATGAQIIGSIFGQSASQGTNFEEVAGEVFALLGYKDGKRFFKPDFDPRVVQLQQQLAKLQGKGGDGGQDRVQVANINAQAKLQAEQMRQQTDLQNAQLDFRTQKYEEDMETQRELMRLQHDVGMAGMQQNHEMQTGAVQQQHDIGMAQQGQRHDVGMQQQQLAAAPKPAPMPAPMPAPAAETPMMGAPMPVGGSPAVEPPGGVPAPMAGPPGGGMQQDQIAHAMHAFGGNMQQGIGSLVQIVMQGFQSMAQGMEQTNMQLAQSLANLAQHADAGQQATMQGFAQMAQSIEASQQQTAQAMAAIAEQVGSSSKASGDGTQQLLAALTRKRKILRGADGKVEGLE